MKKISNIRFPDRFQGSLKKKCYFEGWYFKIVSRKCDSIFAIIPGIALNRKEGTSHAFIQVLDGIRAKYYYVKYPVDSFSFDPNRFAIRIENNNFSAEKVELDIHNKEIMIQGKLKMKGHTPIPKKLFRPGVMGPFSFFPFVQTNHGIISMNHTLEGFLNINNQQVDFTEGKGYIEKDWGRSFPSHWIWMQSNHFEQAQRSFMFSLGKIQYLGLKLTGFLTVLWDRGQFCIMSTYTGAKIRALQIAEKEIQIRVEDRQKIIDIHGKKAATGSDPLVTPDSVIMMTPVKGNMVSKCIESMKSTVEINFWKKTKKNSKKLIFSDISSIVGLEIMGIRDDFL